jgi:hypothetical protein
MILLVTMRMASLASTISREREASKTLSWMFCKDGNGNLIERNEIIKKGLKDE